jgi:hypothetical protein
MSFELSVFGLPTTDFLLLVSQSHNLTSQIRLTQVIHLGPFAAQKETIMKIHPFYFILRIRISISGRSFKSSTSLATSESPK